MPLCPIGSGAIFSMTQMVGRGLRGPKAGGTEFAYIVSFVDSWKSYIMWAVPEKIYYDEIIDSKPEEITVDLTEMELPTPEETELNYISQAKILEFAQILNEAIDTRALEALDFFRLPITFLSNLQIQQKINRQ